MQLGALCPGREPSLQQVLSQQAGRSEVWLQGGVAWWLGNLQTQDSLSSHSAPTPTPLSLTSPEPPSTQLLSLGRRLQHLVDSSDINGNTCGGDGVCNKIVESPEGSSSIVTVAAAANKLPESYIDQPEDVNDGNYKIQEAVDKKVDILEDLGGTSEDSGSLPDIEETSGTPSPKPSQEESGKRGREQGSGGEDCPGRKKARRTFAPVEASEEALGQELSRECVADTDSEDELFSQSKPYPDVRKSRRCVY